MATTGATAAAAAAASEEEDQARIDSIAKGLQTRDAMRLYNWLSQRCFSDCVTTFYRRRLGRREQDCVRSCVHKFLLLSSESTAHFAVLANPGGASPATSGD